MVRSTPIRQLMTSSGPPEANSATALPGSGFGQQARDVLREVSGLDILETDAFEDLPHGCANGDPDIPEMISSPRIDEILGSLPADSRERTVEGAHDVGDGHVGRVAIQRCRPSLSSGFVG